MLRLHVDRPFVSPYAMSAFVALEEKGVPYEIATIDLAANAQHAPSFRDPSLTARIPALEHDAFWIAESSAIVEYVDEAFPAGPPILPRDLRERARARQVMSWVRSDLMALREARPTSSVLQGVATAPLGPEARAAADKLVRVAGAIVPRDRTTLFSTWSVADADLAMMLMRLVANRDEVPAGLRRFAEAQWARPSVRKWVDRERPACVSYR